MAAGRYCVLKTGHCWSELAQVKHCIASKVPAGACGWVLGRKAVIRWFM
jgi:hypothetical protein